MNIDWSLLPPGSRVLCALSGGADSVCLLHLLTKAARERELTVFAAHCEHGLRGEESLRDMDFVRALCDRLAVPLTVKRVDVPAAAAAQGLGIEEAARQLRYAFLEESADALGCDRIATAHNAGDRSETMLMNLCRGSGAAGLRGIPRQRGRIVRPLLDAERSEILDYLAANGLEHVEDSSNASSDYTRNRLRQEVLPLLRVSYPRLDESMGRTAALLADDEDCLGALAEQFITEQYRCGSLPTAPLLALHRAVASRVLRRLCPQTLSFEQVSQALDFCTGSERGYLDLPGIRLRRERGRLYFTDESVQTIPERTLIIGGRTELPECGLVLNTSILPKFESEIHSEFKTLTLSCDNIKGDILVSSWHEGDTMRPARRNMTKSLRRLFSEAGYTRAQRALTPVLRDADGVLAVWGLAVDERAAPKFGARCLRIESQIIEKI